MPMPVFRLQIRWACSVLYPATRLPLTLANGTTTTFTVGANAATQLRALTGKRVNVQTDAQGNVVAIVPAERSGKTLAFALVPVNAAVKLEGAPLRSLRSHVRNSVHRVNGIVTAVTNDSVTIRLSGHAASTIAIPLAALSGVKPAAGTHVTIESRDGFESAVMTSDASQNSATL